VSIAPAITPDRSRRSARAGLAVLADRDIPSRSDAELIAQVVAGPEPAAHVLRCAVRLAGLPFWERRSLGAAGLVRDHGVTPERAVRLAALWELAERWYPDERPTVTSPRDAMLLLDRLRHVATERVVVIMLDARHRPQRVEIVAQGTLNSSRLQPRDVLAPALQAGAASVIIAHNHPSGDARPSAADRHVTTVLREAGALMGVRVLDHIIVARTGHHSFRETEQWDNPGGPDVGNE
jgi:DNA repair protein RadC